MTGNSLRDMSLYIHVPFCSKKCPYCHFFVLPNSEESQQLYIKSILKEWKLRQPQAAGHRITSIYFGGGTPSLLPPQMIETLLQEIAKSQPIAEGCEITIEANPEQITASQLFSYHQMGINRLSFGVQSFDDRLLQTLGRTHDSHKAKKAIEITAHAGIQNISIDLMFDIPYQTLQSWETSLLQIPSLPITHLSLYNLVFDPGTVFHKKRTSLHPHLPSEEESLSMLKMATDHLPKAGLVRYEISAFALPGYASYHNMGYWTGRPFIGLGPSAFSYLQGVRSRNIASLTRYASLIDEGKIPEDFQEELTWEEKQRELLAVELRLIRGVDLLDFQSRNGPFTESLLKDVQHAEKKGWVAEKNGHLFLTEEGLLFYDSVASEISSG